MNDDIVVSEIQASDPAPATEQTENGSEVILDSTPLKKFFYGNSNDLSDKDIADLNFIWAHYSRGAQGPGEILGRIRDLERGLSAPPNGVSRVQHILSYVQLLASEEDLRKQKSAYYG